MKKIFFTFVICFFMSLVHANAAKKILESKIESVALFKNGLAFVTRSISVSEPGDYIIDLDINPVHGSFWIDSQVDLETQVTKVDPTIIAYLNKKNRWS